MSKMKPEKSRIKSDILLRVRLLYILFILAGLLIFARLVWVQLFSSEVAYNAERLAGRIFTEQIIPAQRGNILTRDGDPLATSIFRYRVEFDFGSPGLDSVRTFHEQSDSLSKLLAAYFGDRSAAEYRRMFRTQHAKHYQVKYRKDTLVPRSEGRIARWIDRILDREFVPKKLYDTLRDHTPVQIFPRDIDYTEWETLRKYPLLNWNMGMVYNLRESDERIYPQGELGRRTIGLTGDRGNYGIEAVYREELAGRDGRATRQRIARGFYGRVVDGDNIDPIDGLDVVTTLDLDVQDVANRYLREQLEAQNAIWGTTIVMEVRTGEILALVNLGRTPGGGYAERENYAIGRNTEPGSTFKPFVYGAAFDKGMSPADTIVDQAVEIPLGNGEIWRPDDESTPSGKPMSLRDGLVYSRNRITAQLMQKVGPARVAKLAKAMGVRQSPLEEVPSLALGTSPVTLKEMVSAYATLANGGGYIEPVLITRVEDSHGKVLEEFAPVAPETALRPATAYTLLDVMRGVVDRGTGAAIRSQFGLRGDLAGKTGTTQDNTDGWFILMHPQLVAGAWVGFNDNRITLRSDYWGQGARSALPIVGDAFHYALANRLVDPKARFVSKEEPGLLARGWNWLTGLFARPEPAPAPEPPLRRISEPEPAPPMPAMPPPDEPIPPVPAPAAPSEAAPAEAPAPAEGSAN